MTRGLFVVRCQVSIARRSKTFCINQQPSLCGQLQGDKRAGACDKWPMVSLNDSGAEPPQEKVLTRVRPMVFARWSCRTHEERYLQFGHMQPTDGRKWPPTTGRSLCRAILGGGSIFIDVELLHARTNEHGQRVAIGLCEN